MSLEDLTADQLLARAREMEPSHNLVQTLSKDPEARSMFQRYLKKKNPNLSIPEVDSEDRMTKLLEAERAERVKLEERVTADEVLRRVQAERARVQAKFKFSDEDMKAVEALMVKSDTNPEPIPYYERAADFFQNSRTASIPTPAQLLPPTFQMPEKEIWGKGIGNPANLNRIALDEAQRAWRDVTNGKVAQQ